MDDLRAVMDAVGSERAAVVASMAGTWARCLPLRTPSGRQRSSWSTFASFGPGDGFADEVTRIGDLRRAVGRGHVGPWDDVDVFAPDVADQAAIRSSWGRYDASPVRALSLLWCR